jgi:hypothetical protein
MDMDGAVTGAMTGTISGGISGRVLMLDDGSHDVTEDEAMIYRADGKKIYPCQFCGKVSTMEGW